MYDAMSDQSSKRVMSDVDTARAAEAGFTRNVDIDRAADAGYKAFATRERMPSWVTRDELLIDAWHCGRRQASDRSQKR